jgi:hypothetical protein
MFSIDTQFITLNRASIAFGCIVELFVGGTVGILLYLIIDRIGVSYIQIFTRLSDRMTGKVALSS